MSNKNIFILIVALLILGTIATIVLQSSSSVSVDSRQYDTFAQCLKDKGATFYGAFWCPHCQAQKKAFGSSSKLLPYVECSTLDTLGQTQICKDKKIEGYPTWMFADPIKITDKNKPIVCTKEPGLAGEDPLCSDTKRFTRSKYATTWIFPTAEVSSEVNPVNKDNDWIFPVGAQLHGEISFEELSNQTSCPLPK